jgi:glucose-6-phosphate 1-dehydrogenase
VSRRLQLSALAEQSWRPVHLDTSFARELGEPPEPYERLLHAAIASDHQPFAREDSVEETWRIVQPLLDHPPDVRPYLFGSWGAKEPEALVRGHPRWQQPWLPRRAEPNGLLNPRTAYRGPATASICVSGW